jgi:membrane protein YqaA with SNARE-associated domain
MPRDAPNLQRRVGTTRFTRMNQLHIPHWLQPIVLWLGSIGGVGLLLIGFLDSSFLPLPVINDLLVVELSMRNPARMPYYALMATVGSVLGCVFLYFVARKGGELVFRKRAGARAEKIRHWVQSNGFASILVTALLPPPTPFKIFVLAAAVFKVPLRSFTLALLIARSLRYFAVGFLAVKYGEVATSYLLSHPLIVSGVTLVAVALVYITLRLLFRAERVALKDPN